MSAKMKKRMVLLKKPDCWAGPAARGGAGCVPKGFAECGGANTLDPVANPKAGDSSSKASGGDNVRGVGVPCSFIP